MQDNMARETWGDPGTALGQHIRVGNLGMWREIIGVVGNVHDDGVASCLDAKTGRELWSKRLGGKFSASPLYADGKIYFCGDDSHTTTVVKAAPEYIELAAYELDDGFMASPSVAGKALILRTRSAIYRVEE